MTSSTASSTPPVATPSVQKLSLSSLTAMVIGSMVGAGIFNLPGRFATATGPFGAIIAWVVAGTGMYMLARVFQALAEKRPDIDSGVFAYAKAGFGDYMGFLSAFGYWLGSCLGNVFYWVLIGSTLGRFFPEVFGDGSSATAIIVSLVGIWAFHFMILRGIEQATFINSIVTVAKIVPIIVAILAFVFFSNYSHFSENLFGGVDMPEKSLIAQVRDDDADHGFCLPGHRRRQRLFPLRKKALGCRFRHDPRLRHRHRADGRCHPAALRHGAPRGIAGCSPSLAGALELSSDIGGQSISLGLLVSVLGAYLAWSLICAEVLFTAAKSKDMPRLFAAREQNRVPAARSGSPISSSQLFVIIDLLVARRLQLHAQHDQRHGAVALSARRRHMALCSRAAARAMSQPRTNAAATTSSRRSRWSTRFSCSPPPG